MEIVRILLTFVEVVASLLLLGVILIQQSKGGGLGTAFGGGMGETLFGSRAGNILTRITITLGVIFLVNTLLLAILSGKKHEQSLMAGISSPAPMGAPAGPPPAAPQVPIIPASGNAAAPAAPAAEASLAIPAAQPVTAGEPAPAGN